ncbi:hypothetical protein KY358_00875 [Candidatus Woesearchaeota archaeon]|nr:hypothetical protein [Candidatus Woesearchaeota archaeon]
MGSGGFNLKRQDNQTLLVECPEKIPSSLWGFLAFYILNETDPLKFDNLYRSITYSSEDQRKQGPGEFNVSEKWGSFHFVHAYIYDSLIGQEESETKIGLNTNKVGPIYVPDGKAEYIDQIIGSFKEDKAIEKLGEYKGVLREMTPKLFEFFYTKERLFGNSTWYRILGTITRKMQQSEDKRGGLEIRPTLQLRGSKNLFYFPKYFKEEGLKTYLAAEFILLLDEEIAKLKPLRDPKEKIGKGYFSKALRNLQNRYSRDLGSLL